MNIFKAWITSALGVIIYVMTSVMIYRGTLDWVWGGVIAYAMGTILLLAPETIEKNVKNLINRTTLGNGSTSTPEDPNIKE